MSLYNVIDTPSCIRAVPTCVSSIITHLQELPLWMCKPPMRTLLSKLSNRYLVRRTLKNARMDRIDNVSQTSNKNMNKIARIRSTPQVIRACICMIGSILQVTCTTNIYPKYVRYRQGGVAAAVAGVKRLRHLDIATGLGLVARVPEHQSPAVTNFTGNKGVTTRQNSENQPHQNKTLVKIKIQAWVNHEHVCS